MCQMVGSRTRAVSKKMEGSFARIVTIPTNQTFDPIHATWEHTTAFNFANMPTGIQTLKGSRNIASLTEVRSSGAADAIAGTKDGSSIDPMLNKRLLHCHFDTFQFDGLIHLHCRREYLSVVIGNVVDLFIGSNADVCRYVLKIKVTIQFMGCIHILAICIGSWVVCARVSIIT